MHCPFEPTIFPMSWYWMQTKHHKYVPTTDMTIAEQGTTLIQVRGGDDKHAITVNSYSKFKQQDATFLDYLYC